MDNKGLTIKDFVKGIFEHLSHNSKTITDLKSETGFHHNTIRGYLELIEFIQSQPKLILERTGHSYLAKLESKIELLPPQKVDGGCVLSDPRKDVNK